VRISLHKTALWLLEQLPAQPVRRLNISKQRVQLPGLFFIKNSKSTTLNA
jgi:hypothetical protein